MKINILVSLIISIIVTALINLSYNIEMLWISGVIHLISFAVVLYTANCIVERYHANYNSQSIKIEDNIKSFEDKMTNLVNESNKLSIENKDGMIEELSKVQTITDAINTMAGQLNGATEGIMTMSKKNQRMIRISAEETIEHLESVILSNGKDHMQALDVNFNKQINQQKSRSTQEFKLLESTIKSVDDLTDITKSFYESYPLQNEKTTDRLESIIQLNTQDHMQALDVNFNKQMEQQKLMSSQESTLMESMMKSVNALTDISKSFFDSYSIQYEKATDKQKVLTEDQSRLFKKILEKNNQEDVVNSLQSVSDELYDQKRVIETSSKEIKENNDKVLEQYSTLWQDITGDLNDVSLRHQELLGVLNSHYKVLQHVVSEMK